MDHVATLQGFHKLSQTNSNFRKLIHRRDRQSRAIFCLFCNTHIMCARVAHEFDLLPRSPRANSGVVQNSGQFGAISSLGSFAHCTRLALLAALVISHPLPPPSAPPPLRFPSPSTAPPHAGPHGYAWLRHPGTLPHPHFSPALDGPAAWLALAASSLACAP